MKMKKYMISIMLMLCNSLLGMQKEAQAVSPFDTIVCLTQEKIVLSEKPTYLTLLPRDIKGMLRNQLLWAYPELFCPAQSQLQNHVEGPAALSISSDGNCAFAGLSDGTARLLNLTNKDDITWQPLSAHTKPIETVSLAAAGNWAMTGSEDGTVRLWNLTNKAAITSVLLLAHTEPILCVSISADSNWGLTVLSDQTTRLWNFSNKDSITSQTLSGDTSTRYAASLSPDGDWALTGSLRWNSKALESHQ